MTKIKETPSDREIVVSRVIDAPRERVWKALTDPKQLDAWWGPNGFKNETQEFALEPGGVWKHTMVGPDGARYPNVTRFEEISAPERLVFSNGGKREGGPGTSFRSTWTLKSAGGKTEVTIRLIFKTSEERDFVIKEFGALEGGKQTLGKLARHVGKPEFELKLERVIDAPLERVWRAWAEPERLSQWFAPKPLTLSVEKMDFETGGGFAMTMHFPNGGPKHPFSGVYGEVEPRSMISWSGEFPGDPAGNIRTEVRFEAAGQKTKLSVLQTFSLLTPVNEQATKGARQGWTMTLDQLAEFAAKDR